MSRFVASNENDRYMFAVADDVPVDDPENGWVGRIWGDVCWRRAPQGVHVVVRADEWVAVGIPEVATVFFECSNERHDIAEDFDVGFS